MMRSSSAEKRKSPATSGSTTVKLNRAGFFAKDDALPSRLTREPMPEGPAKGSVCRLEDMLEEYYRIQGWDHEGRPKPEKLHELGLS